MFHEHSSFWLKEHFILLEEKNNTLISIKHFDCFSKNPSAELKYVYVYMQST